MKMTGNNNQKLEENKNKKKKTKQNKMKNIKNMQSTYTAEYFQIFI